MIRSGIILVSLIVGGCLIPVILAALQKDHKKAEISGNSINSTFIEKKVFTVSNY